jgi:glycosyltransferase involved in cell wall biosynthesis
MVTSRSKPEAPARELKDGVHVYRTWFPGKRPVGWILHALASIPTLRAVAKGADVLHAQDIASVIPCERARGRGARTTTGGKTPLVTTYHTSHFLVRAQKPEWKPVLGWMVRAADKNLAASQEIASVAESLAPDVKVEALANGVDTSTFRRVPPTMPASSRRRLLIPRRLYPKNGVEYFVRAMPYIAERVDVEAVIVGDGPERARLEALARELGAVDRIRFMGAKPHEEMPGIFSSCELAVIPSLMEATSVAALEAMSCELPVAASNVGGLPEIVDEGVGALFPPADPRGLADTVIRLLAEPSSLSERGKEARRRVVAHWSNDRLVDRHLEIYRDLTGKS